MCNDLIAITTRPIHFHGDLLPTGTYVRIRFPRGGDAVISRTDVFGLSKRVPIDAVECP